MHWPLVGYEDKGVFFQDKQHDLKVFQDDQLPVALNGQDLFLSPIMAADKADYVKSHMAPNSIPRLMRNAAELNLIN